MKKIIIVFMGIMLSIFMISCDDEMASSTLSETLSETMPSSSTNSGTSSSTSSTTSSSTSSTTSSSTSSTTSSSTNSTTSTSSESTSTTTTKLEPNMLIADGMDRITAKYYVPNSINFADVEISEAAIYASPNGNGDGTFSSPYSFTNAIAVLNNQNSNYKTLYLLGGSYDISNNVTLTRNGSEQGMITLAAYNDEEVILDFTNQPFGDSYRGVTVSGRYWYIYGIEITKAGDNGMLVSGFYNRIENCVFSFNQDSGFQLSRSSSAQISKETWPSYNYILNCTSYGNYDSLRETDIGEDADGFAAKLTSGDMNIFNGCISYRNSDDGWDLYCKDETNPCGTVIIMNCVSFQNGYPFMDYENRNTVTEAGDGNGFKMGSKEISIPHVIINCIAFENLAKGFDDNNSAGPYIIKNCTSFNNGRVSGSNFSYHSQTTSYSEFENCISYSEKTKTKKDVYLGVAKNSYFVESITATENVVRYYDALSSCDSSNSTGIQKTITKAIFASTSIGYDTQTVKMHQALRNNDKTLNLGNYLKVDSSYHKNGIYLGAMLHS